MANDKPTRLELGRVVATPGVIATASRDEILSALARHVTGDWGDVDDDDRRANDDALTSGARILSAYSTSDGTRFWIITDADRTATTVLLPDEY